MVRTPPIISEGKVRIEIPLTRQLASCLTDKTQTNPKYQWQITVHQYSYMVDYHSPTQTEIHVNTHLPTHSDRKHHRGRFMSGSAYRNPPPWVINQQIKTDDLIGWCGMWLTDSEWNWSIQPTHTHRNGQINGAQHIIDLFNGKTNKHWKMEGEKEKGREVVNPPKERWESKGGKMREGRRQSELQEN